MIHYLPSEMRWEIHSNTHGYLRTGGDFVNKEVGIYVDQVIRADFEEQDHKEKLSILEKGIREGLELETKSYDFKDKSGYESSNLISYYRAIHSFGKECILITFDSSTASSS